MAAKKIGYPRLRSLRSYGHTEIKVAQQLEATELVAMGINRRGKEAESARRAEQIRVSFTLSKAMPAGSFLYYGFTNFFQNHRRYLKFFSVDQMQGDKIDEAAVHSKLPRPNSHAAKKPTPTPSSAALLPSTGPPP